MSLATQVHIQTFLVVDFTMQIVDLIKKYNIKLAAHL